MQMFNSVSFRNTSLITMVLISGISVSAQASQYVADLVTNEWQEDIRQVDLETKMYSRNLYGNDAAAQIMFKSGSSAVAFVESALSVNSDSFTCRDLTPAEETDLYSVSTQLEVSDKTKVCEFTPTRLLKKSAGTITSMREYEMHIMFDNASNRSVVIRHQQPVAPQCDASGDPSYNVLNSCSTMTSNILWSNNNIKKPTSYDSVSGLNWTPLVVKGEAYEVELDVRKGKVRVVNGIKMKVSGEKSASPNDEILDAFTFDSCEFEDEATLTVGLHYCTFTAEETGFLHIPLKRKGSGDRRVITTVTHQ